MNTDEQIKDKQTRCQKPVRTSVSSGQIQKNPELAQEERVPEGRGCHTESSVPKGLTAGAGDGEETLVRRP